MKYMILRSWYVKLSNFSVQQNILKDIKSQDDWSCSLAVVKTSSLIAV